MEGYTKNAAVAFVILLALTASLLLTGAPGDDPGTAAAAPGGAAPDSARLPGGGAGKAHPKLQSSLGELSERFHLQGAAAAKGFADERGIGVRNGRVTVVLEAAAGAEAAAAAATAAGGELLAAHGNLVQAEVPMEKLGELAASGAIAFVREPQEPTTFTISEGVADIGADAWQSSGQSGAGVKIAVLDPGFAGYNQLVAAGELPAGVVTRSFRADGDITGAGEDHGSACAEIVYDVAPGAQLYLVNFGTDVELGNAVDYLIAEGVDVVSASWGFFGAFRGDGQGNVNDMVAQAQQADILWVNAAGNAARYHWSGPYADADADAWHEYAAGDETNSFTISAGYRVDIFLTWNKWPATDQDYDLYLIRDDATKPVVAASEGWQSGTQPPSESISYTVPPGKGGNYFVAIRKYSASGDATFKLYVLNNSLEHQVAAGSLSGQPTDSPNAMTVGAVAAGTTTLESFSSRGPTVDGRTKPDIVAPDRVSTATYGATAFWGTSASTPHAAGAAALVQGVYPAYTPASLQGFIEERATDLGTAGKDNLYGSGKLGLGAVPLNCGKPPLSLSNTASYWASYADYLSRELSVAFSICNSGEGTAFNTAIVGSINTGGVVATSTLPLGLGDIGGGNCTAVAVKYYVPVGVQNFVTTVYATASDGCNEVYSYPGPY